MAKEYIEREAAIKIIRGEAVAKYPDSFYVGLIAASNELNVIPAADVAPVVHGRWIDKGEYAVCMECGERSGTQYNGVEPIPLMTQFCPNCGAKMDGGKENAAD